MVISPNGTAYTGICASDEYNSSYAAENLFSHDMSGVALGAKVDAGAGVDWAIVGTGPGYVSFQLDQVYEVSSLFYAQRIGGVSGADVVDQISIWSSSTAPFAPSNPDTPPLATLNITNKSNGIWTEYPLPAKIIGRYFVCKVEEIPPRGSGNIGGNELRLGGPPSDTLPPQIIYCYPEPGAAVKALGLVEVNFSEPVAGIEASDLLINGVPATNMATITPSQFLFTFPQPASGAVQMAWAPGNAIHDLSTQQQTLPYMRLLF